MEVFVEEGKSVREGQVLARLDDSQMRAALSVAQAQLGASQKGFAEDQARLKEAEQNLDRRQRLLKEQVVGKAEVDSAQSEVDALKARIAYSQQQIAVAESQVRMRQTDLNDMVVRAPFSGVAISKDAQPGEMVSPVSAGGGFTRTGICTIVDMASLEIEVDVNESYINRVKPAQKVEAVLDAYPDWRIPGHVITTVPTADRQKATVRVRIGFGPSTGSGKAMDPRILPDMGVKVSFLREDEPAPQSAAPRPRLLAPKTAVRQADGKSVVFVVRGDRVERRAVQVGTEEGEQVEVLSGLTSGDRVVVDGPPSLKDGDKIRETGK
jgi:RND family efflux transporter MFP subunit